MMLTLFSRRAVAVAPPVVTPVVVPVVVPRPWVPGEWSLNPACREHAFDDSRQLAVYGALPRRCLLVQFIEQAQAEQEAALVASRCWS